ncbi:MAG: hypothetical protein SH819_14070 [Cytophagales bacterium]|nr:hypothetical protein [Cytophagales bacterium]
MKNVIKISSLVSVGVLTVLTACQDPELPAPSIGTTANYYNANFTFANATVDAPALDFYVNGARLGTGTAPGMALTSYTMLPITSSGTSGSATANTSIRAKAATGTIGGLLGGSDLIFRSTNNGVNNFAAVDNGRYTVFAIDSINRPVAQRLFRITPTIKFADVTYFNPNTKKQISASRRDSIVAGTTVPPPGPTEAANLLTIGLVPLGLTDPGGVRYFITSDAPLVIAGGAALTNAGIRFVNAVANANGITVAANANGTSGGRPIWVRLRPSPGTTISLASSSAHIVNSTSFNPTVGSRATIAVAFTSQVIASGGIPINYALEVSTDAGYATIVYSAGVSFPPGKNYTVFVRGELGKTGSRGVSHGIVTH